MKPRPFDYVRPDTVEEAVAILAEHGDDARILAGGQTLLAMLNLRVVEPAILVDITRIPELDVIREIDTREGGGKIEVGAAVTQNRLMAWPALRQKLPLLAAALPFVGHFQTRNKGTVCGSIAHADPTSEIPLSLAVLGGEVVLRSPRGTRVLAADDFQQGMLATAREPDELITAVRFPVMSGGVGFREVARRHGDFAIASAAALLEEDANGKIKRASLTLGGVATAPVRMRNVEKALVGQTASEDVFRDACEECRKIEAIADVHAPAAYRQHLAAVLSRRALVAAHGRVGGRA